MAFGKRESLNENCIEYAENIDLLLHDLKSWGYKDLTKDELLDILGKNSFSISRLIKMEISRILDITLR